MVYKVDRNHSEIVAAFKQLGCTVCDLAKVGDGCPDLIVGLCGINLLVEVKDGELPPSKKKLRKNQQDWHDAWRGQCCVVECIDDVIAMVRHHRNTRNHQSHH